MPLLCSQVEPNLPQHPTEAANEPTASYLSTAQVGALLGLAESSIKRHADAGRIASLRSAPGARRRFTREHVIRFLRAGAAPLELKAACAAQDGDAALATLLERIASPADLEACLDAAMRDGLLADDSLLASFIPRLPALLVEVHRLKRVAVVAGPAGTARELLRCVFTARGYQVLVPADSLPPDQLPSWIRGLRAQAVAFHAPDATWSAAASRTATELPERRVFVLGEGAPSAPLVPVVSFESLGAAL